MIPKNAEKIIEARIKGFRPADMVLISITEPPKVRPGAVNPIVIAMPGIAYDWRWVRGLEVCVCISNEDDWPAMVKDIAIHWPNYLALWNHADQWGAHVYLSPTPETVDSPRRQWQFDLDFLPWMDFQNHDFVERRRYERDENGVPYVVKG